MGDFWCGFFLGILVAGVILMIIVRLSEKFGWK